MSRQHLSTQDLRVAVVTIQCPAPSETFAARDILSLRRLGASVTVHSLRGKHADHEALVTSFGLEGIPLSFGGPGAALRGLQLMMRRPLEAVRLIGRVIRHERKQPRVLVRAIAVLPRIYEVLGAIEASDANIVHCFWGHYPALVFELMDMRASPVTRSIFLGSYDMLNGLETSRRAAESASCLFTHARANLPALEGIGMSEDRITVAYRGIDLTTISGVDPERARDIDILCVCRIIPGKGVGRLLAMTRELVRRGLSPRVVVIGDGARLPAMREFVTRNGLEQCVELRGFRPIADVFDAMSRARVFALLSDEPNDRLPNSVKEAMYLGCKCIVGQSVGIEELIPGPDQGIVTSTRDPKDLADIFEKALSEPDDPDRRARVREFIRTTFNAEESMKTYSATWLAALGKR